MEIVPLFSRDIGHARAGCLTTGGRCTSAPWIPVHKVLQDRQKVWHGLAAASLTALDQAE